MQETGLAQLPASSCRGVATRFGVGWVVQAEPADPSAIVGPSRVSPTATQSVAATQLTPARTAPLTLPVDCIVQVAPLQASTIAVCVLPVPVNQPTAVHDDDVVHETLSR